MLCRLENKEGILIREIHRDGFFLVVEIPERDAKTDEVIGLRQFKFSRWQDYNYTCALYKEI